MITLGHYYLASSPRFQLKDTDHDSLVSIMPTATESAIVSQTNH